MKSFTLLVVLLFGLSGIAISATKQASADAGKKLFHDSSLGTNGKTCNTCHPNGKGLESSGVREDIADVVNGCIAGPLKGKVLDPSSMEMQSMILYIKSLGAKKSSTSRSPATGC